MEAPEAPEQAVCHQFSEAAADLTFNSRPEPSMWVKVLCEYRDSLQGLILMPDVRVGATAYRFLYAS